MILSRSKIAKEWQNKKKESGYIFLEEKNKYGI